MKKLFLLCSLICLCFLSYSFVPDGYHEHKDDIAADIGDFDHSGINLAIVSLGEDHTKNLAVLDNIPKDVVVVTELPEGVALSTVVKALSVNYEGYRHTGHRIRTPDKLRTSDTTLKVQKLYVLPVDYNSRE